MTTHPNKSSIPITRTASFSIEAPSTSTFGLHVLPARRFILIRSAEASPHADALAYENVYITTAPGATVTLNARISASTEANLGTAIDLLPGQVTPQAYTAGTPFHLDTTFFTRTVTAPDSGGSSDGHVLISVPIASQLLIPNRAGNIKLYVSASTSSAAGYKPLTYAGGFISLKEVGLKLLVQPQETTRGDKRALFVLGRIKANTPANNPSNNPRFDTTQLTVLVLADQGAHIGGTVTFGDPSDGGFTQTVPGATGPGGRVKLRFQVRDSVAPRAGLATLSVTSSFRGASVTRIVRFGYGSKA